MLSVCACSLFFVRVHELLVGYVVGSVMSSPCLKLENGG